MCNEKEENSLLKTLQMHSDAKRGIIYLGNSYEVKKILAEYRMNRNDAITLLKQNQTNKKEVTKNGI